MSDSCPRTPQGVTHCNLCKDVLSIIRIDVLAHKKYNEYQKSDRIQRSRFNQDFDYGAVRISASAIICHHVGSVDQQNPQRDEDSGQQTRGDRQGEVAGAENHELVGLLNGNGRCVAKLF